MTATPVPLEALLSARRREGDAVEFEVSDDWLQGRTSFGGLIAVFAVQAMRDVAGGNWPLRALQTNFIGPIGRGALRVAVQVIREGKNVRQVQATVLKDGQTAALVVGVFAADRQSSLPELAPKRPPAAVEPDPAKCLPYVPGIAPAFVQHIDFHWAEGALPYSGGEAWDSRIHLRLRDGQGVDAELLTVMMADAAPTPAVGRLREPVPGSSVSWSLELRPLDGAVDGAGWWRVDKDTHAFGKGYANESSKLWAPNGELAALGYQVVAVYG